MRRVRLSSCFLAFLLAAGVAGGPAIAERGEDRNSPKSRNFSKYAKKVEKVERKIAKKADDEAKKPVPVQEAAPKQRLTTPEPDVGTLVYRPEKREPLTLGKLGNAEAEAGLPAAVLATLTSRDRPIRVTAADKKAMAAHYLAAGFKPLWIDETGVNARGQEILAALAASGADGMEPADYLPPAMGGFSDDPGLNRGDPAHLAGIELGLTAMALKYARHASGGRLIPNRLTSYNDITPERVDPALALKVLSRTPFPASYLQGLQPRHPAFAAFRTALADLRANMDRDDAAPIAPGPTVKAGESDERIVPVRARLARLGFLANDATAADPKFLDETVVQGLKAFQVRMAAKPSGRLDAATLRLLNKHDGKADERRLVMNMERLRWLPKDLGYRHVFVNQASFELGVMDRGREVWRSNVVIGTTETQTASFHDEMETVVFNPSWGVPASIVSKEMLPLLRSDPSYLDRKGFRVINKSGKVVESRSINWNSYGDRPPFSVQQPPSDDNALGDVKFLFPNEHAIYMHDTPTRQLFSRPARAFSHGCVRVENPRDFAAVLLGKERGEIDAAIESGRSHSAKVNGDVKVHIAYFTAWPGKDGKIAYYPDVYGRDAAIERAYGTLAVAAK